MTRSRERQVESQGLLVDHVHNVFQSTQSEMGWGELNRHWGSDSVYHEWHSGASFQIGGSDKRHRARGYHVGGFRAKERRHDLRARFYLAGALSQAILREPIEVVEPAGGWSKTFEELRPSEFVFGLWVDTGQRERAKNLRRISRSESQEDVLVILESAGFSREVEELRQYLTDRKSELEEGDYPGIRLDSLKAVSQFLISNLDLPFSAIKADSDGYADLEWYLSSRRIENDIDNMCWVDGGGQIVLRFVTPNLIEFALLSGPWLDDAERLSLSGTMSHSKMRVILDMFSERMISYHE